MSNKWIKLTEFFDGTLYRGDLIKFPSKYPFENEVVMMIAESPCQTGLCLITITGYKAGINCFQIFPTSEIENKISGSYLISNWSKWVYPECLVEDVMVRSSLEVKDFNCNNL
jgi:hypothetical protein